MKPLYRKNGMPTDKSLSSSEKWSGNFFFVLACVGAAVGLGSIWRFPYMAFRNGGGAFLFPYIVCLAIIGIPLCLLELGLGRWGQGSIVAAFKKNHTAFTWIGWWILINSIAIVFYYCVVLAWCVQYFIYSFTLAWGTDSSIFFTNTVLNLSTGPDELGGFNWHTLMALAFVWGMILFIVRGGLPWISKALLITVPLPFILLIAMAIRGLSLPGASEGVAYFLKPRFADIWHPSVWAAAISQTVLALGLAMGQYVAYASKKRDDSQIAKSAVTVCLSVLFISILAGIVTFAMMGFIANHNGVNIEDLKLDSIFLAFVSYPMAISSLPLAPIWGIIFFLLLIAIGLDSAFAVIEATLPSTEEISWHYSRKGVASIICFIGFLGGVIFTTRGGLYLLDIVDHWVEKYTMPSLIVLECILFAWLAPIDKIGYHIKNSWPKFAIKPWKLIIRFLIPIILLVVFSGRIIEEGISNYQSYPRNILYIVGWGVFFLLITLSVIVGFIYNIRVTELTKNDRNEFK